MKVNKLLHLPWAIHAPALEVIVNEYAMHLSAPKVEVASLREGYSTRRADRLRRFAGGVGDMQKMMNQFHGEQASYALVEGVAVIMVTGPLTKNYELITYWYDGTAMTAVADALKSALKNPMVKAIMLYVDSPGGTVDGTQELANYIYASRGGKPIIAFTDGSMYSAAMWIGASADASVISGDTAGTGSIGVLATHYDISKAQEMFGLKVTEIYAGQYKTVGTPNRPLTEGDKAVIQSEVDYLYSIFVNDVAKYRATTPDDVLARAAEARCFIGTQGMAAGLVDGVSTYDQLLIDMAAGKAVKKDGAAVAVPANISVPSAVAGMPKEIAAAVAPAKTATKKEESQMDLDELKASHSALYQAVLADGRAQGLKEGARGERARADAIRQNTIAGHEDLAAAAIAEGTGLEGFLLAQTRAEKDAKGLALKKMEADAAQPQPGSEAANAKSVAKTEADATPEEKTKAAWDKDSTLRAEFNNNYAAYEAFAKADADGRVKIKK